MIKFIGSIYFTLILIASVTLIVITGTFVESYTDSHLFAAQLTYGNPLFGLLLWFFFLNIFVSTLLRWPFKLKHVPFIITHFGLLMILGGQLAKHYYGVQGVMQLSEGCSSCEYFSEHSQALQLNNKNGSSLLLPIQNTKIDTSELDIKLVSYHPNGSESFQSWVHQGNVWITGLPPIPIEEWEPSSTLPKGVIARLHHSESTPWHIFAVKTNHVDSLMQKLTPYRPYLIVLDNDKNGNDTLPESIWVSLGGQIHRQFLDSSSSIAMYDGGFGGYTSSVEVPFLNFNDTPEDLHDAIIHAIAVQLRLQAYEPELLSPPLQQLYKASKIAKTNFVDVTIAFLDSWHRSGEYLYLDEAKDPLVVETLKHIDPTELCILLSQISPELTIPAKKLHNCALLSLCLKAYGLEISKFTPPNKEHALREYYAACLFCENAKLAVPKLLKLTPTERISFLQSFPIDAEDLIALRKAYIAYLEHSSSHQNIPQQFVPTLGEILEAMQLLQPIQPVAVKIYAADFPKEKPRIESPLKAIRKPESKKTKLEDHRPIATFEYAKNDAKERFTLVYDPFGTGLQWPVDQGNTLVRFQPNFQRLPYTLKLRQARQINYAHSSQPFSYEADLWFEPQHRLITLSMNEVYETHDGFRFYLSGITPTDPGAWKKIQIVVNHDPAKYWLTYPGAVLLLLGAFLLFFYSRKKKS